MTTSNKEIWRELGRRFNPFEPAVPPEWWVERQDNPALEMSRRLGEDRNAPYHILLMGPVGSGKTTELFRIAHFRRQAEDCIVFLDVNQHFERIVKDRDAFEKIHAWEILFLIGLGLIQKGHDEGFSEEDLREPAKALAQNWQRLAQTSDTPSVPTLEAGGIFEAAQLLVPAITSAAGADTQTSLAITAGTGFISKAASSIKNWFIPMGCSQKPISDQDSDAQRLLKTVNDLIELIQKADRARRLLVFIDGLDRILDMNRARMLMISSILLTSLRCALVITAPYALYQRQAAVLRSRYSHCYTLFDQTVLDKKEPWKDGPGVDILLKLYQRRTSDLNCPGLIHPEWLRYIAYYSAGQVRNFVRLIGELCDNALLENAEQATQPLVDKTLNYRRRYLETYINKTEIQILQGVIDDKSRALPHHEKTQDLLQDNRLICYHNDIEWYFPHTLLTMFRLQMTEKRAKPQSPEEVLMIKSPSTDLYAHNP